MPALVWQPCPGTWPLVQQRWWIAGAWLPEMEMESDFLLTASTVGGLHEVGLQHHSAPLGLSLPQPPRQLLALPPQAAQWHTLAIFMLQLMHLLASELSKAKAHGHDWCCVALQAAHFLRRSQGMQTETDRAV